MGRPKAEIVLSDAEREQLVTWTRRRKTAQALALRSRIILECATGIDSKRVAQQISVTQQTVSKWRNRFAMDRLDGLLDAPRPGAPRTIDDARVDAVIAKTLETVPKNATHWSTRNMARETGCRKPPSVASGALLACSPIARKRSSSRPTHCLSRRCATSSGCTLTRRPRRWCCASMRRARFRRWTAPSRSCRWHPAFLSGVPTTTCATARRRCSLRSTSPAVR